MKYYAVVYQMGKVASTSIVDTLGSFDHIEAVQSHFLGDKALVAVIPSITDPDISDYFFRNEFGQFVENVKITRRFKMTRSGQVPNTKLLLVSLARDPVNWIRSSVVQDVEGYAPILGQVAKAAGVHIEDDAAAVTVGLPIFLEQSCDVLDKFGGIDAFQNATNALSSCFEGTLFRDIFGARRMFLMLLRPADWFRGHFEAATQIPLSSMTARDGVLYVVEPHADLVIVRYEDFKTTLPRYLVERGICRIEAFSSMNISESKLFAEEVADVLESSIGARLRRLYGATAYARTFGYA